MIYKPERLIPWNEFDEHSLIVGLGHFSEDKKSLEYVRYPNESNKSLKERILRSTAYMSNSTRQGMINNLTMDLGISTSGVLLFPWYNSINRSIFYLSESPWASPSGINVYVSTSGNWTEENLLYPRVRASGYASALSGWILWNQADIDPELIPSGYPGSKLYYELIEPTGFYSSNVTWGKNTRILEFIGDSIPAYDSYVKVEYEVQTGIDEYGMPIINWRSDFSNQDDYTDRTFRGQESSIPSGYSSYLSWVSGNIAVWGLDKIGEAPLSGYFFDISGRATNKLIELKTYINDQYPLFWGKFRYDDAKWDQLKTTSIGVVPAFYDESTPSGVATIVNGSRFGVDLDVIDVDITSSGIKAPWYPKVKPGEFYIGDERYYLFGRQMRQLVTLTPVNALLSGKITSTVDDPLEFDLICGLSSGRIFNDSEVPNNPYICRLHEFSNPMSGVYYRTSYVDRGQSFNASGVFPSGIDFDGGNAFYYDYKTGDVWASGITPTEFWLLWEHASICGSGTLTFSGGYGFNASDLNPYSSPHSKVFYFSK